MAAAAWCGGQRWRAQATAMQGAGRKEEEGERGQGRDLAQSHSRDLNGASEPASSQSAPSQRASTRALASVSPDGRAQPVSFSVNTYKTHF